MSSADSLRFLEPEGPYRAPRQNQTAAVWPSIRSTRALVETNRRQLQEARIELAGLPLDELRRLARTECLQRARDYLANSLGIPLQGVERSPEAPLMVTGHQPVMIHPGVWVKNAAVDGLAQAAGGTSLHLIVDNDIADHAGVLIPVGDRQHPRMESLPFEELTAPSPWEEATINHPELWNAFGTKATSALERWNITPLAGRLWNQVPPPVEGTPLVDALTRVRVVQERGWNIGNLELPISRLSETRAFSHFLVHLLAEAERFRSIYNEILFDYRREHGIQSRSHPVPELERHGDRVEAPFWIWQTGASVRERLHVRCAVDHLELFAGERSVGKVPMKGGELPPETWTALDELRRHWKIRPRALSTTLFARICLSDLFVHGIGGAKYDEMTDRICREFFPFSAPAHATLTATLHLPLNPHAVTAQHEQDARRRLREARYNPERLLADQASIEPLLAQKRDLIAAQKAAQTEGLSRRERRARRPANRRRYRAFQELRQKLEELATPQRQAVEAQLESIQHDLRANQILKSREFAAYLHPEPALTALMQGARQRFAESD